MTDYEIWGSIVIPSILIYIFFKLFEKNSPNFARVIYLWFWKTPWFLGLFTFWISIAFSIILLIIEYFYYPLQDEIYIYSIIFILGCSIFSFVKFCQYIDGPHWYKLKYIKLDEFDQCIYRCNLTAKGLDNYDGCYAAHEYKCKNHYEELKRKGTVEYYLNYYSKNENLINKDSY